MTPRPDPIQTGAGADAAPAAPVALRRMGFFEAVALTMLRSLDYRGRSTRLEFASWLALTPLVCGAVTGLFYIRTPDNGDGALIALGIAGAALLIVVPGLPLAIRRLHDLGRSSAWLLVPLGCALAAFLAFVYGLFGGASMILSGVLLVCTALVLAVLAAGCLLPSEPGANRHGPQPSNEVPA